jgi:hypothetical protein
MLTGKWREQWLVTLRANVKYYTDCTEPGKPVYHSLSRLAMGMPGYTGYVNSTPIESWTEERRIQRWNGLKAAARKKLNDVEQGGQSGGGKKLRKRRYQLGSTGRLVALLRQASEVGISGADLYEKVYGEPARTERDRRRLNESVAWAREKGHVIKVSTKSRGRHGANSTYFFHPQNAVPEADGWEPDLIGLS